MDNDISITIYPVPPGTKSPYVRFAWRLLYKSEKEQSGVEPNVDLAGAVAAEKYKAAANRERLARRAASGKDSQWHLAAKPAPRQEPLSEQVMQEVRQVIERATRKRSHA